LNHNNSHANIAYMNKNSAENSPDKVEF